MAPPELGSWRFSKAIDAFIVDWTGQGRLRSPRSELAYRATLDLHCDDVANIDPRLVDRAAIKSTLGRWAHPNTQYTRRAHLCAFYDWTMEEGYRETNPARQTRRPRRTKPTVYRLTRGEAASMLRAAISEREQRVIYLGLCAGLRLSELLGLQRRHFQRPGFIWVSSDIGKNSKPRWIPVIEDLAPVVAGVLDDVAPGEYVLPAERWADPGINTRKLVLRERKSSRQVLRTIVGTVAVRAGIRAHIHPHLLRHGFGDHLARHSGLHNAQAMLGHESVSTTEAVYTGEPTLDELTAAVAGFSFF